MIRLRIVLILLLSSLDVYARSLNYIESQQLRLSSQQQPGHWVLPFSFLRQASAWETNTMISEEKDVMKLYDDVQSKNQQKILKRLQDSYGKPYDASAKVNFGFRRGNFAQFFSANAGAVLLVTDPVFPEMKGFLFQDYMASSSYLFKPLKNWIIKPQLNYGVRRTLDRQFSVGDLVDTKLNVNFNKQPFLGVVEVNLMSVYSMGKWGQILAELNSFPLIKNDYQYWDTFLGYVSPKFFKHAQLYGGYSPIYAGNYDVGRTIKTGTKLTLGEQVTVDLFTSDKFYPGAMVGWMIGIFEVSAFTFERAYDDYGRQKSRQYGANFRFFW